MAYQAVVMGLAEARLAAKKAPMATGGVTNDIMPR